MKFAFKATTTIAILSLALFAFAPAVLAVVTGDITITPSSLTRAGDPYSVKVNVSSATNINVQVILRESTAGGSPVDIETQVRRTDQFGGFSIEKSFNNGKPTTGTWTYSASLDAGAQGKFTTAAKSITIGGSGSTPSGGTTPTGGPLKGEDLPDKGAPTLFGLTGTGGADLLKTIDDIGNWVFVFLIAVAAIFLIVSGFMYITAAGSTENITKAKQMLINALIGVVIALLARGMVQVIRTILGG